MRQFPFMDGWMDRNIDVHTSPIRTPCDRPPTDYNVRNTLLTSLCLTYLLTHSLIEHRVINQESYLPSVALRYVIDNFVVSILYVNTLPTQHGCAEYLTLLLRGKHHHILFLSVMFFFYLSIMYIYLSRLRYWMDGRNPTPHSPL